MHQKSTVPIINEDQRLKFGSEFFHPTATYMGCRTGRRASMLAIELAPAAAMLPQHGRIDELTTSLRALIAEVA